MVSVSEPRWLEIARSLKGVREIPGPENTPAIASWLARLGAWWRDDETPWCGTFVAHCMQQAGIAYPRAWYRAKAWADWGRWLMAHQLAPGAVLVFERQGGGHVGFYVGETPSAYLVLGGNQGNRVCVTRIARERCIAMRWPPGVPLTGGRVLTADADVPLSVDEA